MGRPRGRKPRIFQTGAGAHRPSLRLSPQEEPRAVTGPASRAPSCGWGGVGQAGTWLSGCHRSSDDPSNDAAVCFCVPGPLPSPYPGEKGPLSLLSSVKQNRGSGGAGSLARVSGSRPETESVGKTDVWALSCHDRVFVSFFFFPSQISFLWTERTFSQPDCPEGLSVCAI